MPQRKIEGVIRVNHDERWDKIKDLVKEAIPNENRKYIYRTDKPNKGTFWIVNIDVKGKRFNKCFPDKRHGGKNLALLSAIAYRDKIIKECGLVFMKGVKKQPFIEGKGVCFSIKRGWVKGKLYEYPVVKCYWHEPSGNKQIRKTKTFSVNKYGYKRAIQKAIKHRKDKLKEIYG